MFLFGKLYFVIHVPLKREALTVWNCGKHACYIEYEETEGGNTMSKKIDFNNISDEIIYDAFCVDGNEAEALADTYLELYELIGKEAMLKLYKHYRGDKLDLPMRMYRIEFVADLAKQAPDRRERAKISRAAGYTSKAIENHLSRRKQETE